MKCDKCGEEKPDAMLRMAPIGMKEHWYGDPSLRLDPTLCSECCSKAPDREWMRASVSATKTA